MNDKVLVFSIALEGYSGLFKPCIETQRAYCKAHGFTYILVDKSPRTLLPTEAAWLKIFLLREVLKAGYKWVAFIDADCEIRPHTPSFREYFEEYGTNQNIFLANGFSGRINSGVIFMKFSVEALDYLDTVIKNGDHPVSEEDKAPYENGHMIAYGKNNPNIHIIESKKWNNNSRPDKNSYIQHYSGGILRQLYLNEHKNLHFLFKQKKRLWNLKNRFKKVNKTTTSMNEMNFLLNFYRKKFPQLFRREN
jgi:hypothetical protein